MVGDPSLCEAVTRLQAVTAWRGQDGQSEAEQPDHPASLGDSNAASHSDEVCPNADRENTRRTVIREKLPITCALPGTVHSTGRTEPERRLKISFPRPSPGRFSRGSRFR